MILYLLYSTGPTRKQPHHSTIQWAIAQNHGRPEVLLPGKRNYQVRSEAHERLSPNRTKTENMWILASGETLVPKTPHEFALEQFDFIIYNGETDSV